MDCGPLTQPLAPAACFGSATVRGVGQSPTAAAAAPCPLDQLETSSQPQISSADDEDERIPFINSDAIPFEHRGWQPMRRRVMASMIRTEQSPGRRHDFWHCCENHHVFRSPDGGEIEVIPETCHDRFCLPCGARRSRRIAEATAGLMKEASDKLMFITLTIRGRPSDSLASMLDRLRDAWKELRRLRGWRDNVRGGVVMLEVKYSRTSGGHWHPHYHMICEGNWVDPKWLSAAWSVITRGSDQVDVQRVREERVALSYVSKYASKPLDPSFVMRPSLIDEAMVALKGVRLAACFGTWHGTPLSKGITDEQADETAVLTEWVYEGTADDIAIRAGRGDTDAIQLLSRVERIMRLRHALTDRCTSPPSDPPAESCAA